MSRLLFLAVIAAVVYWLLRSYSKQITADEDESAPAAEDMVRCAHCGVHLPKREGVLAGGEYYCSEAHRRAHFDKPE